MNVSSRYNCKSRRFHRTLVANISENIKSTILQGWSILVIISSIDMALESDQTIIVVASIAISAMLGKRWHIKGKLMMSFGIFILTLIAVMVEIIKISQK